MFFINIQDKLGKVLYKDGKNTVPLKIPISLLTNQEQLLNPTTDGNSYEVFAIIRSRGASTSKYETSVLRTFNSIETWVTFKEDEIVQITESEAISSENMYPLVVCYRRKSYYN